jgi:hypothetical protein
MSLLDLLRQEYVKGRVIDKYRLDSGNVGLVVEDSATSKRYHVEFKDKGRGPGTFSSLSSLNWRQDFFYMNPPIQSFAMSLSCALESRKLPFPVNPAKHSILPQSGFVYP